MATTITEYIDAAEEQTLKAVRRGQDAIVAVVRTWSKAVETVVPAPPKIPYADELPSAGELIETSFGFADRLLQAQREFTEKVVAAAAPVLERRRPNPKPAAARKPRAAAA